MTETIEAIIRHLLDSLGDGVIFFDPDDRVRWTNGTFERMRGKVEPVTLLGRSIFDCHPARDRGKVSQILNDLKTGRETIRHHRAKRSGIVAAENEPHYDIFYTAVRDGPEKYLGTAMIIRDIREIKNLQDQVQRSEEKYKDLIERVDSGIFALDIDGRIVYANNGLLKMVGYGLSEMMHRLWTELLEPEERFEAERVFDGLLSGKEGSTLEVCMVHRSGTPIHVLVNLSALEVDQESQSVVRGIVTDITAQKELETERMERERFEGVVEMAGATCHHLNQPLANILVRTQMLLREMDRQDPRYRLLEILESEAVRMANITKKIQNITRYETEPYVEGHSRIVDLERATRKK